MSIRHSSIVRRVTTQPMRTRGDGCSVSPFAGAGRDRAQRVSAAHGSLSGLSPPAVAGVEKVAPVLSARILGHHSRLDDTPLFHVRVVLFNGGRYVVHA